MSRYDLKEEQWAVIEPVTPKKSSKIGRPRNDNRQTLNGILYVLTRCAWETLPCEYGSDSMCWRGLNVWSLNGTWERIWWAFLSQLDTDGKLGWAQAFLDRCLVPAKIRGMKGERRKSAKARRSGGDGSQRIAHQLACEQRTTAQNYTG